MKEKSFSQRFGYRRQPKEIVIRKDAPFELREALLAITEGGGLRPSSIRSVVCRVLRKLENEDNWSEYPNIWREVHDLVMTCDWFKVYDICEALYDSLASSQYSPSDDLSEGPIISAAKFQDELNDFFMGSGIGWQMVDGEIRVRGSESFEGALKKAGQVLQETGRAIAYRELREAIEDLSRRPEPDITGAIQHSMAALECVARDISGDQKATLGEIVKTRAVSLNIPRPLDEALARLWGFASETGRHLREGRSPSWKEAELMVGISASLMTYLCR